MNWNISFLLISGVFIQLLGETHAVACNHPSPSRSICKNNINDIDVRHEICFLKKTYTNGGITYERGGTNETECMKNAALSSVRNSDCKLSSPPVNTVCYDCCIAHCPDDRFCNEKNSINLSQMPSYMKTEQHTIKKTTATTTTHKPTPSTTTPTTTPTAPTMTPTTTPTTISTTMPTTTPTTLATTTPIPTTLPTTVTTIASTTPTTVLTTSAAVNGTKCLVCTEDQRTSCSAMDYNVCSGDRPYCLNEIVYQNGNWTKTLHRCASRVECYWDYWIGTGNGTDCIQNGACTYCCQGPDGKPCNARTEKPTNLTNFGKTQNRAYKCSVTGPQNSNTIQDCPPSDRFCLNDVYYDTDPNTNNLITRDTRRCASQEQCKGKWLQSRKTDACLTGNMTGVDASKTGNRLLCYYCCESNANTPCNLHPKPDQIKLFIQPTTIPTVSTSLPVVSTSLPAVSSTLNGTKCLVCIEDQSNSCSSVDYTVCSGERPYCLNEIIYHNGKQTKTLHRCASEVECYWDYWIGTGNGTDCIQNGVCVYCCQGSNGKPCNAMKEKPTSLSNFGQPQNRAYKCVVTGLQNGNTIQDCPLSERFCLNDVYYDTDPNTNNLITRDVRRCASQEQCKGKWLQSKNINACLTGNMTGVDASKTGNRLLCHYCCESNTMTPCNLHPKPDQINLFLQPTSLPIVSSTAVCQDKPGVDCSLLNATNICANPNAQHYCAAFCGHC